MSFREVTAEELEEIRESALYELRQAHEEPLLDSAFDDGFKLEPLELDLYPEPPEPSDDFEV